MGHRVTTSDIQTLLLHTISDTFAVKQCGDSMLYMHSMHSSFFYMQGTSAAAGGPVLKASYWYYQTLFYFLVSVVHVPSNYFL